jgi:hypothetical protein
MGIALPDNSCMLPEFSGGNIDIKYRVDVNKLYLDYSIDGGKQYQSCISGKKYLNFHSNGYIGISSGNPLHQNVNDIDVHRIDFFNMNSDYYKHDAHEIVEDQFYYKRDENGFLGKTVYPWSAKLNTIELGKVAMDVFEMKRSIREFKKEQFNKQLNVVKKDDDISEALFKIIEQMRVINLNMRNLISSQIDKKQRVLGLEQRILKEEDYRKFLAVVKVEDDKLYDISKTFSDLTSETKRILDTIKQKSE